jgi:hypothetical protein
VKTLIYLIIAFIAKKLCPELILVENHFSRYSEMSKQVGGPTFVHESLVTSEET